MKRQILFGTMLSAALAVGVGAQQQTPGGQKPGTTGADQPARSGQTVTVTGCLQRGGQIAGATGTQPGTATGTAGAGAQTGYILTNVTPSSGAGATGAGRTEPGATATQPGQAGQPGQTGQAGQAGQTGAAAGARAGYRLTGEEQKLQEYVGQRVEVTGTMTAGTGAGAGTATGTTTDRDRPAGQPGADRPAGQPGAGQTGTTTAQAQAGAQGTMPMLRVTSVKPVSGNCP